MLCDVICNADLAKPEAAIQTPRYIELRCGLSLEFFLHYKHLGVLTASSFK